MANIVVHKVVSNVDTIIVLKNPTSRFAVWEDVESVEISEREENESADQWGFTLERLRMISKAEKRKENKKKQKGGSKERSADFVQSLFGGESSTATTQFVTPSATKAGGIESNHSDPNQVIPENEIHDQTERVSVDVPIDRSYEEPIKDEEIYDQTERVSVDVPIEEEEIHDQTERVSVDVPIEWSVEEPIKEEEIFDQPERVSVEVPIEEEDIHDQTERVPVVVPIERPVEEHIEEEKIHYQVCSGNLMSASPVFSRMLRKDGWEEGNRTGKNGYYQLKASDWDEEAFKILMNIFHLCHRKVPRTVSLEMLAKIAVLVDYYDCSEAIELYTDMWIADLKAQEPVPTTYCRQLILWIWIAWIFKLSEPYHNATAVAIKQSKESIQDLGLPIPTSVTEEIDLRRYQAIENIVSRLHDLLDEYRSDAYLCPENRGLSFQCGSMLLGALTKQMDAAGLLTPRPQVPFANQSFDSICDTVRSMKPAKWAAVPDSYYRRWHSCDLANILESCLDTIAIGTQGLSL